MLEIGHDRAAPGAHLLEEGGCLFRVWAPHAERVEVILLDASPGTAPLRRREHGYHEGVVEEASAGARYLYRLDGGPPRPDPASRFQPEGTDGPSEVLAQQPPEVGDAGWSGMPLEHYVLYELHVGTYTPQGTFAAIVPHLDGLKDLGVTAIELMPIAQFPGTRNWGYDGVCPYAVQNSYGGPVGLLGLVEECHRRGLAVVLDVVYNHLGPEGNYLAEFGPYFTDRYRSPWGLAINFDGRGSDEVRDFFIHNALYWITRFGIDALRVDAIHGIYDRSASPFLAELCDAVHRRGRQLGREVQVIAESDLNDVRVLQPTEEGGYGFDGQWNDDFHHALHALLTGEGDGYYEDFGKLEHLVKAYREGFVLSGGPSTFRGRRHGSSSVAVPAWRFVVFSQNHDQVGNRVDGKRLAQLVSFESLKLAAGAVLLAPFVPLLFMGEEYGETAPFHYFVSHSDQRLIRAVRRGRAEEASRFGWAGSLPDPQAESTWEASRLRHERTGEHGLLRDFYRELLALRRELPPLARLRKDATTVGQAGGSEGAKVLWILRWSGEERALLVLNLDRDAATVPVPLEPGVWVKRLDSSDPRWGGPGSRLPLRLTAAEPAVMTLPPQSLALFVREASGAGTGV